MQSAPQPGWEETIGHPIFGKDLSLAGFHRALVLLSVLGLVVRIGFYVEHANTPSFGVPTLDQKYYDTVAKMLLAGQDLHELHGYRPLLYPMFLAFFYRVGGDWGVDLALLAQHLLWDRDRLARGVAGRSIVPPSAGRGGLPNWAASAGSPAHLNTRDRSSRRRTRSSDSLVSAASPRHRKCIRPRRARSAPERLCVHHDPLLQARRVARRNFGS